MLGPLEVRRDGQVIEVRGSKRRAVLALLLLQANEVVRTDLLIEELWGERTPSNASAAIHNHVSRLRKDLGDDVLVTKPWGYVLRADPERIDLNRFERLVREARPMAAHERATTLAEALALWRGPALADLTQEPGLATEIARLNEVRIAALEQRIDADLELGHHEELVPELESLIGEHPLRERLRGQLILALYRSGRQAEALETYRETRRVLVEELGIEPSSELRELERAILCQDPALASAPAPAPAAPADVDRERSRWRWPRSPLAILAGLLLVAGIGVTTGVITTRGGVADAEGVVPASSESEPGATAQPVTDEPVKTIVARPMPQEPTTGADPTAVAPSHRSRRPVRQASTTRDPAPTTDRRATNPAKKPVENTSGGRTTPVSPEPTAARPFLLTDDFDDPLFDFSKWTRSTYGTGSDFVERDGRLELGLAADSVQGPLKGIDGHYGTACRVIGDFDARVDYELVTWPARSGASVELAAYFWSTKADSSRFSFDIGDGYGSLFGPSFLSVPTADTAGALRLRRHDGVLATYYRHAGGWVKTGSARAPDSAIIVLQLGSGPDFAQKAVRVAFDNFSVEAAGVDCPNGVPRPPRKAAP